jgi:hypothetical protein
MGIPLSIEFLQRIGVGGPRAIYKLTLTALAGMTCVFSNTWSAIGAREGLTIPPEQPRKRIDFIWLGKDSEVVPVRA